MLNAEQLGEALRRAFNLGQTYWRQADSDSYKQNALSDKTLNQFNDLVRDTVAAHVVPGIGDGAERRVEAHIEKRRQERNAGVAPVEAPSLHQRALDSLKALMYRREQLTAADFARVVLTIQALQEHLFGKTDPVGVGVADSKTQAPKGLDHG